MKNKILYVEDVQRKEYFEKGEEMKLVKFPNIPNFKFPEKNV